MGKLLKKELRLALHPTAPIFLLLSTMLLIPNYPYLVIFFYTGLAVFFTCLTGRENHDVDFTLLLPVAKRDVVRARMLLVALLEIAQLLVAVPFAWMRQVLIQAPNAAGMDANVALMAFALVQMGLFNAVFFRVYYKDVRKVGTSFLWSSAVTFLYIMVVEATAHAVPFVRDALDTPDPAHMAEKLSMLLIGAALFTLMTWLTCRRAQGHFEEQDL
ncbi:MAG: ABC-2 transporter permease [Christensenellaceae bacterium]|nr:ABC-2 transporter permease [Christensenellaceae bacterium]